MPDKRVNNGGHSTAPTRPDDKRLNPFRKVLKEAATPEEVKEVIRAMYDKAKDGDTKAATLFLSYYLGKPKESLEVTGLENLHLSLKRLISFDAEEAKEIK